MDKIAWAFCSSPFKELAYKFKRCRYIRDNGVKFSCSVRPKFKIGDCTECRLYKPEKRRKN